MYIGTKQIKSSRKFQCIQGEVRYFTATELERQDFMYPMLALFSILPIKYLSTLLSDQIESEQSIEPFIYFYQKLISFTNLLVDSEKYGISDFFCFH